MPPWVFSEAWAVGDKLVAVATTGSDDDSQVIEGVDDPPWTRTVNPKIKRFFG
jgi:hypothetical protein